MRVVSHHTSTIRCVVVVVFSLWHRKYSSAAYVPIDHGVTNAMRCSHTHKFQEKQNVCFFREIQNTFTCLIGKLSCCFTHVSSWFLWAFEFFKSRGRICHRLYFILKHTKALGITRIRQIIRVVQNITVGQAKPSQYSRTLNEF